MKLIAEFSIALKHMARILERLAQEFPEAVVHMTTGPDRRFVLLTVIVFKDGHEFVVRSMLHVDWICDVGAAAASRKVCENTRSAVRDLKERQYGQM